MGAGPEVGGGRRPSLQTLFLEFGRQASPPALFPELPPRVRLQPGVGGMSRGLAKLGVCVRRCGLVQGAWGAGLFPKLKTAWERAVGTRSV